MRWALRASSSARERRDIMSGRPARNAGIACRKSGISVAFGIGRGFADFRVRCRIGRPGFARPQLVAVGQHPGAFAGKAWPQGGSNIDRPASLVKSVR
jgi:hypothetical protein